MTFDRNDMLAIQRWVEERGLIPTLYTLPINSRDEFLRAVALNGGLVKNPFDVPEQDFTVNDTWMGYRVLGPLVNGKWMRYWFSLDLWWNQAGEKPLRFYYATINHDPRLCEFMLDCECPEGYEESCVYCIQGDDLCLHHNTYH